MEIILKQDVQNLGYADEIVKVKDGYARNYLIPQGMAILATEANKKMLAETLKQRAFKAEKIRKEAEFLAGKIDGLSVKIYTKASEKGTIQHGIEIDRKKIIIKEDHIKELGNYNAIVNLHKDFNKVNLNLEVLAEE